MGHQGIPEKKVWLRTYNSFWMIIMYLSLYPQDIPEGEPTPLALENLKYFIFCTESFLYLHLLCSKSLKHHISKRVVHFFISKQFLSNFLRKKMGFTPWRAWSYKKKRSAKRLKHTGNLFYKEPTVKRCLLICLPLRS